MYISSRMDYTCFQSTIAGSEVVITQTAGFNDGLERLRIHRRPVLNLCADEALTRLCEHTSFFDIWVCEMYVHNV